MRQRSEHENWRSALLGEMGLHPRWQRRAGLAVLADEPSSLDNSDPALGRLRFSPAPKVSALNLALGHDSAGVPANESPVPSSGKVIPLRPDHRPPSAPLSPPKPSSPPLRPAPAVAPACEVSALDWEALTAAIEACQACGLRAHRHKSVPGIGDRKARWLFVGEGPGREEDLKGEPFVGPAGQLLDRMLAAMGLKRGEDVFIANAVKCRPPFNRTPEAGEIQACHAFLARQIALIQPSVIVALGRPALLALLGHEGTITQLRQKSLQREGIPVIVTYHPAYLLRNPADKRKAWEDLCFARQCLAQTALAPS